MSKLKAYIFPGQGSQYVGMCLDLAKEFYYVKEILLEADEILKYPLSKIMEQGPAEILDDTEKTQPAIFIHSIVALKIIEKEFPSLRADYMAGHSLGEISALTASKVFSFKQGLELVRMRGKLMKKAGELSSGGMAAIIGLELDEIKNICIQSSNNNSAVQIANDNCPGQTVISGGIGALENAMEIAKDRGAKIVKKLAVSIAAHSILMEPIENEFFEIVDGIKTMKSPTIPVISNVTGKPLNTIDEIKTDLVRQLSSPVLWTSSIKYILEQGCFHFFEIGPNKVLAGLNKRIDRNIECLNIGKVDDIPTIMQTIEVSN